MFFFIFYPVINWLSLMYFPENAPFWPKNPYKVKTTHPNLMKIAQYVYFIT